MSLLKFSDVPISISECAKLFGLSEKTVRRAIKSHELPYVIIRDRYRIMFVDIVTWSQSRARLRRARDQKGIGQYIVEWQVPAARRSLRKQNEDGIQSEQLTIFSNSNARLPL